MGDFDAILGELPADPKTTSNVWRLTTLKDQTSYRCVRYQCGCADCVSGFFIGVVIFASECFASCCTLPYSRVSANNCEAVRFVSEKNVRDFLHQGGAVSLHAVRGIQNYQSPAIRQCSRAGAAGPLVSASA